MVDKGELHEWKKEKMRKLFPMVPVLFPIMFPILPMVCLLMMVGKISATLERIEEQLDDVIATIKHQG